MRIGPTGCVGRDAELSDFVERLHGTVDHGAQVVAIVGGPGSGKTALLRALAARCSGARWAQAAPWETDLPGGVLSQLLQDDIPADPVDAAAAAVDRLEGRGPALLVIDDAEYADAVSLQAISTVVRHQRDLPILVVLAVTTLTHALADLASERLLLGGLPDDAVADLAASSGHTLHPSMASALTRHTMGNPRDVLALLDEVPATVWSQPDAELPAPNHLLARARDELETCGPDGGLHQARGSRDDVGLTPQEEAVSTLVAQGLSNREVAAELYVSPKTVQYHLTRIYAKLGVRSRSELAARRR